MMVDVVEAGMEEKHVMMAMPVDDIVAHRHQDDSWIVVTYIINNEFGQWNRAVYVIVEEVVG